jgi:hypothetical protein
MVLVGRRPFGSSSPLRLKAWQGWAIAAAAGLWTAASAEAALLGYEPFTNAPGTAVIGSGGGFGFSGAWQANGSAGLATNTGYALGYTDAASNTLVTAGGAAFFQGSTSASTPMQPIRLFSFSRGTNGSDGVTTWLSFLAARQGPTGTLSGNPYGRGANVAHDVNAGTLQKLAVGNSSGAASNTVGLIPQGSISYLRGSQVPFGGRSNFIAVRIDHRANANDTAWLFVNPPLGVEPPLSAAAAVSSNAFDFSFDRVRIFAGGQSSIEQPYAELVIDEYRLGETWADVTPYSPGSSPPAATNSLAITNVQLRAGSIVLSGAGGSNGATYYVLASTDIASPLTHWPAVATNAFDADGAFVATNPAPPGAPRQFFRLLTDSLPPLPPVGPAITSQPTNQSVVAGQPAVFAVGASGTPPLRYQWRFNTTTSIPDATNQTLALASVRDTNAGGYSVVVTNSFGAVTSRVAILTVTTSLPPAAFYVSTTGNDSNPGTLDRPFLTLSKGLTAVGNSGWVYVRGGTYAMSSKLTLSRTASAANPIRLWAYPGETPIIDSTGNSSDGISISGSGYHLNGLVVMNAGHNGINISGHSNTVENCTVHDNVNTGLHITGGSSGSTYPSYNLILNCDAYRNYDPPIGGNADGFSAKWNLGPGNVFRGCRAWENSDDGWDLWMGNNAVLMEDCWAFRQGINYWGSPQFNGNGNGFKLGGNYVGAPHRLVRSVAFGNHANGIDQNNNISGQTIDQNTSWANGSRNFNLNHGTNTTPHVVRNNLSIAGASSDSFTSGTLATNNSWQVLSPAAGSNDVLSLDESVAVAPRQADGTLPVWPFLRPVPGGRLVDRGVYIGAPYNGAAPDLGAFETGP